MLRGQRRRLAQAKAPAGEMEALGDQLRLRAVPALAFTKRAAGQFTAPGGTDGVHHVRGAQRLVVREPVLEQSRHLARQAQQGKAGEARPGAVGGLQDAFEFVVGQRRHDGRHQHAHRHAGLRQPGDDIQARLRRRGAWLQRAGQVGIQRGDGQEHGRQLLPCQLGKQVDVPAHARRLGDDRHRMPAVEQQFQHAAGDAPVALGRLVGVGVGAHGQHLAAVAGLAQGIGQQLRGARLGQDAGLEIEPRRQVQIRVAGPREAVDAAVLAAAVGIQRLVERQIRRVVAGNDRARGVHADHGARAGCRFVAGIGQPRLAGVARGGVLASAAALGRRRGGVVHGAASATAFLIACVRAARSASRMASPVRPRCTRAATSTPRAASKASCRRSACG